ncbi:cysteine-rich CWC family protein [Acidovorax sp.]|uniref:cysteine-rich CWC family protein n=1 Tax=Acidovorax sp. TaxID=1872122 RepID=UPI00391B1905
MPRRSPPSPPAHGRPASAPSASTCPLCGGANQCAITAGQPAESCWCMARVIEPEALRALAPGARGKACICPACGSITLGQAPGGGAPGTPI